MNHPDGTEQHAEELVAWTGRERLRFLWYRLRLTISEMNYASRRMVELQMAVPPKWPTPPPPASKKPYPCGSRRFINGALSRPNPAVSWPSE
jgi:hypothetical protein